jgi:hypothetical protein
MLINEIQTLTADADAVNNLIQNDQPFTTITTVIDFGELGTESTKFYWLAMDQFICNVWLGISWNWICQIQNIISKQQLLLCQNSFLAVMLKNRPLAAWSSHPPEEQATRVRIPPGYKEIGKS